MEFDGSGGIAGGFGYGNGYTPLANNAIANNNASYAQQQAVMALMAQQYQNQLNANLAAQGPSSGYGTVGGYPSFGGPAAPGTYSPGGGLSPFSGTPLGGYPSGNVQRGPDLPDLSVDPFKDPSKMQIGQPSGPDPYYWSGNFFGANNGSGIGQGEGMAPGMGGFNNPAVPTSPQQWYANGGYNPYDPQTYGGAAQQNVGTGQPNVSNTQNSVFDTGTTPYQTYGGADDIDWMQRGSQGPRPSSVAGWGGSADQSWVQGGSLGARPSTLYDPQNMWGGRYDQDWVKGGSEGARPSTVSGWGNADDQAWVRGGSQGFRPSTVAGWGGADDAAWVQGGSLGERPSVANKYRDAMAQSVMAQGDDWSGDDWLADFHSPSNNYNTFQKGPTYDWQSAIPEGRRDPRVINEIYRAAGETGLSPTALAAILNMESVWNPGNQTGGQFGLAQMSGDMWGDNPFRGTMGGVDFNTYKNDPVGDKQIRAYTDWLVRGGKLNRDGIDVASVDDPVMQAAMLQAIQFAGNSSGWRNDLAQGKMDTYVTTEHPQARELRPGGEAYPTINSMYNAYDRILGGWRR